MASWDFGGFVFFEHFAVDPACRNGGIGGQMLDAGKDLIRGFIEGIKSMAGRIAGAAMDAVKGAVNGVKSFLGIHSPSRLFMDLGSYTGEGFKTVLPAEARAKAAALKAKT